MTHNPNHGKGGHQSRGPSYEALYTKSEYWNIERANRRINREHKAIVVK